jgi:hypothetical protein
MTAGKRGRSHRACHWSPAPPKWSVIITAQMLCPMSAMIPLAADRPTFRTTAQAEERPDGAATGGRRSSVAAFWVRSAHSWARAPTWRVRDVPGAAIPVSRCDVGDTGGVQLLIARNPDPDSRLPYLLKVPLGAGLVFRTACRPLGNPGRRLRDRQHLVVTGPSTGDPPPGQKSRCSYSTLSSQPVNSATSSRVMPCATHSCSSSSRRKPFAAKARRR